MITIWKIVLSPLAEQTIKVPMGAEFLCAREQNNQPCVWFECDPSEPEEDRLIRVYATGSKIDENPGRYLGLVSLHGGIIILHVYEDDPPTYGD